MKKPKKHSTGHGAGHGKYDEAKHKRGPGGRFANKPGAGDDAPKKVGKRLKGETALKTSGVGPDDEIALLSTRLRAYKPSMTVRQFIDNHPKGRAYALRKLAADHKKGVIGFKGVEKPIAPPAMRSTAAGKQAAGASVSNVEKYDEANYSDFADTDKATILEVERDLYKKMLADGETAAEIQAINRYSGHSYTQINGYLRGLHEMRIKEDPTKDPFQGATIRNIDGVLKRSKMTEDVVVYRGVSGDYARALLKLKPGAIVKDAGYVSASLIKSTSQGFTGGNGLTLKLMLPKGNSAYLMNGRGASQFATEHEVLLPRNSRFRIRKIEGNVLVAEVL